MVEENSTILERRLTKNQSAKYRLSSMKRSMVSTQMVT